jgi:hypothetical protein
MITAEQAYQIHEASVLNINNIMLKIIAAALNGENHLTLKNPLPEKVVELLQNDGFIVTDYQIQWTKNYGRN